MPKANPSNKILETTEITGAEALAGAVIRVERINTAKDPAARDRHFYLPRSQTASADGAITIQNGVVLITKASAAALTLAAPSTDQNGTRIDIVSTTAYAHTVTAPSAIIHWGDSGGADDVATFAAYAGAAISLIANAGLWHVVSRNNVTLA